MADALEITKGRLLPMCDEEAVGDGGLVVCVMELEQLPELRSFFLKSLS